MSRADDTSDQPVAPPTAGGTGFDALVGQEAVVRALGNALGRDRLPHALLFVGPRGVGKATCAGILAQALNCRRAGPVDACGSCPSCSKMARGIHPDLLWVSPVKNMIRLPQITPRPDSSFKPAHTPVTEAIGYAPHEGRRRVVVIDEAHSMNPPAQNALLKSLEEPPASTVLILVSSAPASLLPTVRSRCQSLTFSPVPQSRVRQFLETEKGLESAEARLRAALVPGSIGRALSVDLDEYGEMLEQVVDALRAAQQGPAGVVAAAEALSGIGDGATAVQRAVDTLEVGRNVLRDLLVVATGADEESLVHPDRTEAWRAWAGELDADRIGVALTALNRGIDRFQGIPPSVKLALEQTLIELHRAMAGEPPVPGRPVA